MDILSIITVLIIISAGFSYLNERFVKLPGTIGVMAMSVVASVVVLIIGKIGDEKSNLLTTLAHNIDFSEVLLNVMLGFLLFASALHFDYKKLKSLRRPVLILSTLGVMVSTGIFGGMLFGAAWLLHIHLPLIYCFVFGSLISPTDPIAVGAIITKSKIPPRLATVIFGESMFNDAVGLLLFVTLLGITKQSSSSISILEILRSFGIQVLGGSLIGLIMGFIAYRLIKSIKDFQTIFLISLAIVLGISVVANYFHASIPLAAVVAGLVVGNKSFGKDHVANQFLNNVWQLLDGILNTILFVMIGLQLLILPFLKHYWLIGLTSILIILIARMISVSLIAFFELRRVNLVNLSILTWAGLRGGISIAMALSLPVSPYREVILSCCYFIVIFSIIVQGLTLNKLVDKAVSSDDRKSLSLKAGHARN
ncbi:MAG: sodium:proton antiporter [Ferruginibacter sp.]|nr:sodium:proton antiporter [Ferruginibacter sp.]